MNSKKKKVSFRARWNFDPDSDEAIAVEYINGLGMSILQAVFYPEAVYEQGRIDETTKHKEKDLDFKFKVNNYDSMSDEELESLRRLEVERMGQISSPLMLDWLILAFCFIDLRSPSLAIGVVRKK